MNYFEYKNNFLCVDGVKIVDLAKKYGTPLYVYSQHSIEDVFKAYDQAIAMPHLVCYAVKANSNIAIIQTMARLGAGFDIVSKGELARIIKAGGDPSKVMYSGVAKRVDEIRYALEQGIHCFNVESEAEMERINSVALSLGKKAPVSIRVNPDVDAKTHPYISTGMKKNKFGVPIERAFALYKHASELEGIDIIGIDCHIGSQLTELKPFSDALDRVLVLVDRLKESGINIKHIEMGGGLGVVYDQELPPTPQEYMNLLQDKLSGYDLELIIEPGRSMVANAGLLVTQIQYLKQGEINDFAIIDAGMNDMIRPALYEAWMKIDVAEIKPGLEKKVYDVVGPVCESSDFLGKGRSLAVEPDDYIVQFSAGAYGFSMSSTYNSRPLCAEIMVKDGKEFVIRKRDNIEDLYRNEILMS